MLNQNYSDKLLPDYLISRLKDSVARRNIMKYTIAFLLLLITCYRLHSQVTNEELMRELDVTIRQAPTYDAQKQQKIRQVKQSLQTQNNSLYHQFDSYSRLYEEYKIFNYDSAYSYARLLQQTARQLNDSLRITYAKIRIGFTLLSAGMFKETLDTLSQINMKNMPDSVRAEYYSLMGRFYFDLADFDNDPYHTPVYVTKGSMYFDSALHYFPENGFDHRYYIGLKNIKSGNRSTALQTFRQLLNGQQLTDHQLALVASTLSDFYIQNGNTDSAINLLLRAAIADIKSSTKETSAIFNLAGLLYKKKDVKNASLCINQAIADAVFYGARQRKVQVGSILPLIESEKLNPLSGEVKKRWGPALIFLAGAQGEAESIAEILKVPTTSSQFQVRENASEKKLKALPLADYNIVHFVCHGYDRASMPDLQPGIALSPVNDPANDSFLQMGEMTQLPWNADLVTLSACDTGLGDLYPGDGMMGISTMLLATGNRGTVLSRWRVVDASAPLFMRHFYEEIQKGAGKPQALRNAQLGFLRDREDDFAVPRHWAVFKYVGIPW